MGKKILLNLPENDLKKIDALITSGEFTTRTDFIRFSIKQMLYKEERMKQFEELARKLQNQTKKMGMRKKGVIREIREAKNRTRQLISKK